MIRMISFVCGAFSVVAALGAVSQSVLIGAAPKGDAAAVASRIIRANFPSCKRVSSAVRAQDGSIRARCDSIDYLVFTVFDAKQGKMHEVAMNCTAAKRLLNVSC